MSYRYENGKMVKYYSSCDCQVCGYHLQQDMSKWGLGPTVYLPCPECAARPHTPMRGSVWFDPKGQELHMVLDAFSSQIGRIVISQYDEQVDAAISMETDFKGCKYVGEWN